MVCECSVKNRTGRFGKKRDRRVRKEGERVINQWSYSSNDCLERIKLRRRKKIKSGCEVRETLLKIITFVYQLKLFN